MALTDNKGGRMKNKHLLFLALLLVFGFTLAANAAVTTTRDAKGVWFVKGGDSDSMFDVFEAVGDRKSVV